MSDAKSSGQKSDVKSDIARLLIDAMKEQRAPWQRPWSSTPLRPTNPTSGNPYRGINRIILSVSGFSDPRWMTYQQAHKEGWQVQSGSKGSPVVKLVEVAAGSQEAREAEEPGGEVNGQGGKVFALRRYTVFNAAQIKGIPELPERKEQGPMVVCERAEGVLAALKETGLVIAHGGSQAGYVSSLDEIRMPSKRDFASPYSYYSVAMHEAAHSTLAPNRMNRAEALAKKWGDGAYSMEELRAEIASAILVSELSDGSPGLIQSVEHLQNHARYLNSWIRNLEKDPMAIFSAAKDAELMSGYLLGLEAKRASEATHSGWVADYDNATRAYSQ